jgi:hypothetical protein
MAHWNIQVSIQKVDRFVASRPGLLGGGETKHDREITKVLDLAITADSEIEAYDKAAKMLEASRPEPTEINADELKREPFPYPDAREG